MNASGTGKRMENRSGKALFSLSLRKGGVILDPRNLADFRASFPENQTAEDVAELAVGGKLFCAVHGRFA